ncbi:BrnT family toxin [Desulfonema magnum]|uniref:Toxin-antitoxin system, toxin component domain-containing protein n=1 Tax=Desulfonema magnum TaxID=45655 RepID=A0A975GRI0_9BACT|nr:BrnT family toxin [Desulfonema magnum]QTA90942.1 Toxin-antitoxin system, toxin component domain-containing protein [Desulfonema magnum]
MKFEWDSHKAATNFRKHKISFKEASAALSYPMAATGINPDHLSISYNKWMVVEDKVYVCID